MVDYVLIGMLLFIVLQQDLTCLWSVLFSSKFLYLSWFIVLDKRLVCGGGGGG